MSDSDAATLNADENCVGGIQNNEQLREKWKRGKVKTEGVDRDSLPEKKHSEIVLGLQNGLNDSPRGVKCSPRVTKGLPGFNLGHPEPSLAQKTAKFLAQKAAKQRMQIYSCVACKGKNFSTYGNYHRHLLLHISQPVVKLTRLAEEEDEREDWEVFPSDRPQVARKRITVSCHSRSPLKFRLMCTNSTDKKDSFKLVKSSVKELKTAENLDDLPETVEDISSRPLNSSFVISDGEAVSVIEVKGCDSIVAEHTPLLDCDKKEKSENVDSNSVKTTVETLGDKLNGPKEEQSKPNSGEEVETTPSTPQVNNSPITPAIVEDSPSILSKPESSSSPTSIQVKDSTTTPLKTAEKQGTDDRAMRQMKNVESEMEMMQSKSPSVIQNSHEPRQMANDKDSSGSTGEAECDPLPPEFIPIERLEKDGPPPLISAAANTMVQSAPPENVSESHILCEACGETVVGDQTALEDHCLCRGHFKCPICSVACASTDALAVHTKECHPNADVTAHLNDRKKKSLRSVRHKHADSSEKDVNRDSLSDLSNSPSIPSPSADIRTPPLPSPTGVRVSEALQNSTQARPRNEALMNASRAHEQDVRRNSPSSAPNATVLEPVQSANNYPARGVPQQAPQARLPPGRVSDTMPPPLMRPPNHRNNDSQPRSSMSNVPMQAPPALYKVPTSLPMNNTQPTAALPTMPGSYMRGIPASGYQPDLQTASAANPFSASASNHLAASAAALNARYQSMHHPGYPPGSQPQSGYAAYTQPMQTQQRYQMPPPPYPTQLPPHLQQNPRAAMMPPNAYGMSSSQQAYSQSLLKAQLEQARLQLPQPSVLQSMQNLQQEHYQQQQLQQQLFQQPHHQLMQQAQQEQIRAPAPPPAQNGQKRKSSSSNPAHLRYHHQAALQNQQQLQSQLQQGQPPTKQRRQRDSIGIPSKQTDSDCEIIAVQQRGEGVPVIQSIQGANSSPNGESVVPGGDNLSNSGSASVPTSSESTIHLTDSITLSVRPPPNSSSGNKGHSANAVASILATRGITVTPASGASPVRSGGGQRTRPSPPLNHAQAPSSPNHSSPVSINSAISISHSARPPQQSNEGFAVPAPVAAPRPAPRQPPPSDRPPRPPTVDLTDENAQAHAANSVVTCRLCDKQFPSHESLQQHMHVIHQTRNYFRCSICNTKHPSQQALSNHIKRVHKFGGATGSPPELVIPLVDLKNSASMARLSSLGVNYVISLSQLGMSSDNSTFCIPIMSLDSSGQARNNSISGLMSLGTSAVLPIGPVKSLPAAQQHSQQHPQPQPQTVPSLIQGNLNLTPGTHMRAPPHQYGQPTSQAAPR